MKKLLLMAMFALVSFGAVAQTSFAPEKEKRQVIIKNDESGSIIAIPINIKGLENTIFLLQCSSAQKNFESLNLVDVSVNYQKMYVQFTTNSKSITFKLDNATTNFEKGVVVYEGFGLVKNCDKSVYAAYLGAIIQPNLPSVDMKCGCVSNTKSSDCNSGGPGSTGCSVDSGIGIATSGCSVNCGSGTYSCCNLD